MDDLSKVFTNAMGVAQGAKTEADNALNDVLDRWLSQRDFVTREEFDVVRAMATKAREENELLRASIEDLKRTPKKTTKKVLKKTCKNCKSAGLINLNKCQSQFCIETKIRAWNLNLGSAAEFQNPAA